MGRAAEAVVAELKRYYTRRDSEGGGLMRFHYITDNKENKERLDELICEKGLSRRDLGLILKTICLNPDIFLPYEK